MDYELDEVLVLRVCKIHFSTFLCLWVCEKVIVLAALCVAFKGIGLFPSAWGPRWNHFSD